jgi:hypothetical protein
MKLLMFYAYDWWYKTASKALPGAPEAEREESIGAAVVVFVHSEAGDEEDGKGVLKKFLKNTKWIAGKFGTRSVVLHSFNHLGMSKSTPEFAAALLDEAEERLRGAGYRVMRGSVNIISHIF